MTLAPEDVQVQQQLMPSGRLRHVLKLRNGNMWVDVLEFDDETEARVFLKRWREWANRR